MKYSVTRLSRSRFLIVNEVWSERFYQLLVVPVNRPTANYQLILVSHDPVTDTERMFQPFEEEMYSTFVWSTPDALEELLEVLFEIIQDMDLSDPAELLQMYGGTVRSEYHGKAKYRNTH